MLSHRNAHYWLWFLVFGLVSVLVGVASATGLTAESVWLLATGFLGLLFGAGRVSGRLSRPYDLLIGLLFTVIGIIGVLHNLNITLLTPSSTLPGGNGADNASLLGLSLSLPYAMIHTVLGLSSLNIGMRSSSDVPVAAAPVTAAS